jgi:hypothetical protein
MKRILFAVAMLALVFPAAREAEAAEVSVDFFYDNLGTGGSWVELDDYGYAWQPTVAVSNSSWRPYSDGYWAYTDVGWTWVSYEDFGWATYHYGRWTRLRGRGWFWVPGREWGPAWVSWRTGGDYVGWAPLPARRGREQVYEGRPITGQVDVEFDIGPSYYNFVDVRYIGEPVLRERIYAPDQNVTYITRTVNVTNITYSNSVVYNHGPDYNVVSRYSTRQIPRLSIQRETNVDPRAAAQSGGLTRVQGDRLVVAAPPVLQKPARPIAPKAVKEKIARAEVDNGWTGDPKAQAELREKMKKEDRKAVPTPSFTPNPAGPAAQGSVSPAEGASVTPAPGTSPATSAGPAASAAPGTSPVASPDKGKSKGKGKDKPGQDVAPAVSPAASVARGARPAASVAPGTTPAPSPEKGKGKGRGKRGDEAAPGVTPPATALPSAGTETAAPTVAPVKPPRGKDKGKRDEKAPATVPPTGTSHSAAPPSQTKTAPAAPPTAPSGPKPDRGNIESTTGQPNAAPADKGRGKNKGERREMKPAAAPPASVQPQPTREAPPEAQAKPRQAPVAPERAAAPPSAPAANPAAKPDQGRGKPDQGKPEGGKKKKGEPEPAPTP